MKKLSLLLALLMLVSLVGCGGTATDAGGDATKNPSSGSSSGNTQTNTDTGSGSNTNEGTGNEENKDQSTGGSTEDSKDDNTSSFLEKTLYGDFASEDGSSYAFNENIFSYTATSGYCLRGSYIFKEDAEGELRILLTVTHQGRDENSLAAVDVPYIINGISGVPYRESADGRISIDKTWYTEK